MENHNEKEPQNLSADRRNKIIVRTSVIGILANVLLAAAKAVIGFAANSIAVILDAVNNIIKAGIDMMKETLDDILGVRMDKELSRQIKSLLNEEPEVRGAYDLVLHNYGPDTNLGSVHLELPDTMTVAEVDRLTRKLERKVVDATGVFLVGVGVYSHNTGDGAAAEMQKKVREIVMAHDWALQFHGFYVEPEKKALRCDVVMSFDIDRKEGVRILTEKISAAYPGYAVLVAPDVDISD